MVCDIDGSAGVLDRRLAVSAATTNLTWIVASDATVKP
jgi:hypothetical protein